MDTVTLTNALKSRSRSIGFTLCGVTPAVAPPGAARLEEWLNAGYGGQMQYIADRHSAYAHPRHVLDGVQSIMMLGMQYSAEEPADPQAGQGRVSRYAWGSLDYHDLIRERLHSLADYLRELEPQAVTRGVVDTAPLLEREFAQLAGLGWIGKNTLLLSKHAGSYFFLAALLTDQNLQYDNAYDLDHCGTCTACLDACPTKAFPQPYVLDATRCISYLTIELQDTIPVELREGMGDWLFGCDVCQEVCPWNHNAPQAEEEAFVPCKDLNPVDLAALFDLSDEEFRSRFRHTPLWRAHRRGLLRNAAVVLGNQRNVSSLEALKKGIEDAEPLVRAASAWAMGKLRQPEATAALALRDSCENDPSVQAEIAIALGRC